MDEQNKVTFTDEEFDKMLRDGLNTSFNDDEISVSEDLIARTLKAIEEDKVTSIETVHPSVKAARTVKLSTVFKIAGTVAAAAVIGVVGISMLSGGIRTKSNSQSEMVVEDKAFMTFESATAANESSEEDFDFDNSMDEVTNSYLFVSAVADDAMPADDPMPAEKEAVEEEMFAEEAVAQNDLGIIADKNGIPNYGTMPDCYYLSGDEDAALFNDLYDTVIAGCGDVIYDIKGSMTEEDEERIPSDFGYECMSLNYQSGDCLNIVTIVLYENYCEIHDSKPLSSDSHDYSTILYRVDDGAGLADRLRNIMKQDK